MAMPLLFLERLEEKEMPTLQEVKNQMDKELNSKKNELTQSWQTLEKSMPQVI